MTSLFLNIHTGQWWCVGRDAKFPIVPTKPRIYSYDPANHRVEVASCNGLEKDNIQFVRFYAEPFAIFDTDWTFTSEQYGDRFGVGVTFGDNSPREMNGRRTTMAFILYPLNTWRTVEAGESLIANPPGSYTEAMETLFRSVLRERHDLEWYGTDGNQVLNEDR